MGRGGKREYETEGKREESSSGGTTREREGDLKTKDQRTQGHDGKRSLKNSIKATLCLFYSISYKLLIHIDIVLSCAHMQDVLGCLLQRETGFPQISKTGNYPSSSQWLKQSQ